MKKFKEYLAGLIAERNAARRDLRAQHSILASAAWSLFLEDDEAIKVFKDFSEAKLVECKLNVAARQLNLEISELKGQLDILDKISFEANKIYEPDYERYEAECAEKIKIYEERRELLNKVIEQCDTDTTFGQDLKKNLRVERESLWALIGQYRQRRDLIFELKMRMYD